MDDLLRLSAVYLFAAALIFAVKLRSRYKRDVYKRLEETRTHKEMRALEREIFDERSQRTGDMSLIGRMLLRLKNGPLIDARTHLDGVELPSALTVIRRIVPPLDIAGIFVIIAAFWDISRPPLLFAVSCGISALILVLYAVYHAVERSHTMRGLPKMSKREKKPAFLPWRSEDPKTKRKYDARERKIVVKALLLRYGCLPAYILLVIRTSPAVFIAGVIMLIDGAAFHYSYLTRSEAFFCTMQSFSHRTMTPFSHSHSEQKCAEKDGKWIGILMLILGAGCVLLYFFTKEELL